MKMGVTELVFELKTLKLKLRVFLTGCTVAIVTYYDIKITIIGSPMTGRFVILIL